MVGGTRLTTSTRSPPTASTRLLRSVVVVTTRSRSCASLDEVSARYSAAQATALLSTGAVRLKPLPPARPTSLRCLPYALRQQTVHGLLALRRCTDAAVAGHARQRVGVEPS